MPPQDILTMVLPCVDGNVGFPDPNLALIEPDGLLCYGGDLSTPRLVAAYQRGIFPWYSEGEPILWWSPVQRMVLYPDQLHVSNSLRKAIKRFKPAFHFNRNFAAVIQSCANIPRRDLGTWIHPEMVTAYTELFQAGHAFCIEAVVDQQLVGGLYGVRVGQVLCGESMFSLASNGSKYALFGLCQYMLKHQLQVLDCQLHNPHLDSMGAQLISRKAFFGHLPGGNKPTNPSLF